MVSPSITLSEHYNPNSPGLCGPLSSVGICLDREFGAAWVWLDFCAPLISGRVAAVFLEAPDGLKCGGKIIDRTRDGRLWGLCWETRDERDLVAVPLDQQPVVALAAEVARVTVSAPAQPASVTPLPPHRKAMFDRIAAPAFAEWRTLGFPPAHRMPIDQPAEAVLACMECMGKTHLLERL